MEIKKQDAISKIYKKCEGLNRDLEHSMTLFIWEQEKEKVYARLHAWIDAIIWSYDQYVDFSLDEIDEIWATAEHIILYGKEENKSEAN